VFHELYCMNRVYTCVTNWYHIMIWILLEYFNIHPGCRVILYGRVMSRMNESCHIWTSHVTYECVMSHVMCHTHEPIMSCMNQSWVIAKPQIEWSKSLTTLWWLLSVGSINRSLLQNIVSFIGLFCNNPYIILSILLTKATAYIRFAVYCSSK